MQRPANVRWRRVPVRVAAALSSVALALALGWSVLSLPEPATGLTGLVDAGMPNSGVDHPVTAVLLNFRGYDTLLEIGVLLLALLSVWSLRLPPARRDAEAARTPVLRFMVRLLVPGILVVTVYLLWAGSKQPGGAFQAGAVLAAAGELLLLAGFVRGWPHRAWSLRLVLGIGFGVFLAVAGGLVLLGNDLLEYPRSQAYPLILLIEGALTVSIGFTLAALFFGSPPEAAAEEAPEGEG